MLLRGWLLGGMGLVLAAACRRAPREEDPGARTREPVCRSVQRDCDGRSDNGCEVRLGTDAHCGGCGQACGAGERCLGESCQPAGDLVLTRSHTCAMARTGRVWCWGGNEAGEVGDGTRLLRDRPVLVAGIDDAVQLVARERQTCVRRKTGAVVCWGQEFGTVRSSPPQLAPTEIEVLRGATDLAMAEGVFCGLMPNGSITCLPTSRYDRALPRVGPPPGEPVTDAVDLSATSEYLCACRRGGGVTCWELNPGRELPPEARVREVTGMEDALSLVAGESTTCALRVGGTASCWGGGIVTAPGSIRDVMVGGVLDFKAIGAVSDLAFLGWPDKEDCATRLDGVTVCWPPPHLDLERHTPLAELLRPEPKKLPPSYRIEASKLDNAHCALTRTDEVYCWGDLARGRLGLGRAPEQPSPGPIPGVRGASEVVSSGGRACARAASGAMWCWGTGEPPHAVKVPGLDRLLSGRCASIRGELRCFAAPFEQPLPDAKLSEVVQLVPAAQGSHQLSYFALHRSGKVSRVDWALDTRPGPASWTHVLSARVRGLSDVTELLSTDRWTCVRESPTSLRCWESLGKAALDPAGQVEVEFERFTLPEGFEQVQVVDMHAKGQYRACGVQGGRVGCWNEKLEVRWMPLREVRRFEISPGGLRCALVVDGSLWCWSEGGSGMAGDGSLAAPPEPRQVLAGVAGWSFAQRSHGGQDAVYAWLRDGRLMAWGHNGGRGEPSPRGQLGWVGPTLFTEPTRVGLPAP